MENFSPLFLQIILLPILSFFFSPSVLLILNLLTVSSVSYLLSNSFVSLCFVLDSSFWPINMPGYEFCLSKQLFNLPIKLFLISVIISQFLYFLFATLLWFSIFYQNSLSYLLSMIILKSMSNNANIWSACEFYFRLFLSVWLVSCLSSWLFFYYVPDIVFTKTVVEIVFSLG